VRGGSIDTVGSAEKVEAELNAFIERRARAAEKANAEADLWAMSVRRHNARLERERLWGILRYHQAMLEAHTANFQALLERHRTGLRLCEEALGITTDERRQA
jgi:hypothetical protein